MADYIRAPITVDPDELKAQAFEFMRSRFPDWEPADGNLDAWIIEAFAELVAEVHETASDVTDAIFRYYGANIAGVAPINATPASGTVTIEAIDDAGYVVPEGVRVAFDAGGELVAFETAAEAIIPNGNTTVANVPVVAVTPGAIGSGLTGEGQLVDPYDFIASVELEGPTTGGIDAEPDDDYLNRLASELRLLSPRPILAEDFATLAKRIPGVDRAVAIDNYIPAGPGGNPPADDEAERAVYVVAVDASGEPVNSAIKQQLDDLLQSEREVNFIVNVGEPDYKEVDVTYTATAWPDFDPVEVQAAANAAVEEFLSPANWGQPTYGEARAWINETKVRKGELYAVLNSVEGLRYVDSLTLSADGLTPDAEGDLTLPGVVPMPRPGTINGTVS